MRNSITGIEIGGGCNNLCRPIDIELIFHVLIVSIYIQLLDN